MNNTMNSAVRKIHNLLSSGAVTVTGPNQPRILKQKVGATTVTPTNNLHHGGGTNRCYVCDEALGASQAQHQLTEMQTSHTTTKFPNKIGQLVGDAFMVIVSVDDVVCTRCTNLINYLDRLENDVERVRTNLMNLLHKKYGLNDDGGGGGGVVATASPPIKMQKLNSGTTVTRTVVEDNDYGRARKILHTTETTLGKQSPPVSAVQQIKINTPVQQSAAAGTQTIQRKTTKIYKCLSCDYKTSDMRLFNTHYETCKHQNFQCKNCKKIFPNFGQMKQHMVREHNTPMDHTCSVCHFNFMNEPALRKHMEMNHSTSVVVTSTTTLPASSVANVAEQHHGTTSLYTCNHCQFKSVDKTAFDEHLRKHLTGNKPKPFKCRLCAQRFETREAATIHAKQHQTNLYKCGTCSVSFPKREQLIKHFEVHQQPQQHQQQQQQQQHQIVTTQSPAVVTVKQAQPQQQQLLTTQKLLQEHIDEALSENVATSGTTTTVSSTTDVTAASASNIRFFSCHLCSLTFLQEHYYNQHMETHRRDKKASNIITVSSASSVSSGGATVTSSGGGTSMGTLNPAAAALLSDGLSKGDDEDADVAVGDESGAHQQSCVTAAGILGADIESIFEKMHSDKSDVGGNSDGTPTGNVNANAGGAAQTNDKLVITSDEGTGGITFNITIPAQADADGTNAKERGNEVSKDGSLGIAPVSVSIDMPVLDQADDISTPASGDSSVKDESKSVSSGGKISTAAPVSMPSLDDDNEAPVGEGGHEDGSGAGAGAVAIAGSENGNDEGNNKNNVKLEHEHQSDDDGKSGSAKGNSSSTSEGGAASADGAVAASGGVDVDQSGASADDVKKDEPHEGIDGAENESATSEQLVNAAAAVAAAAGGEHPQVAMELDESMQAQVESGQIKFLLNENGQLLQLDNHIITDADGNQILVQDPEQIQQLLQSVGVLQTGDGLDGETLQMMTDANGQMVLVQGENNETQLIDASLLNAEGQLVIQQGQDGELGEGAHVIGEDGTRIPVSVSYTADGQPIVQVQQQVLEAGRGTHVVLEKDGTVAGATAQGDDAAHVAADAAGGADGAGDENANAVTAGGDAAGGTASGGGFFALDELMQQSAEAKVTAE